MEDVRARDQAPVASEGRNPIKAVMRAVGIGAPAPAGDDTLAAGEGQQQLLQERDWDRQSSKQGRRDLPAEVVEKHPSLAASDTSLPTPATATSASGTTTHLTRVSHDTTSSSRSSTIGPDSTPAAADKHTSAGPISSPTAHLSPSHPLMGLSDECGLCAAAPGALESERQALLDKAAQLERERTAHAEAAAEAETMRAHAAARAAELEAKLRSEVTSRRQELLQQQEAAHAELARLEASRASVVTRVQSLEGHLGRLVDEEALLLQQRSEAERLRLEIESARDGIIGRAAELASMTTALSQQQQAAVNAVRGAAAALAAREAEVEEAAKRLRMLQAQQQEARQALAAAEKTREEVSGELATMEADLSSQQRRVDSLEQKLPDLNSQHEEFMARQAQLKTQAQALSADMAAVQAEAERVAREKEEKERLGVFSAERLVSIDNRVSQLSCQAAALQAKAAGAEGLLLAEQARAQAAEAEAHGLQAAAETLGSGRETMMRSIATSSSSTTTSTTSARDISTRDISNTTAVKTAAVPTTLAGDMPGKTHHKMKMHGSGRSSSGSSSRSDSDSDSDAGDVRRTEGMQPYAAGHEGAQKVHLAQPETGMMRSSSGAGMERDVLRDVHVRGADAGEALQQPRVRFAPVEGELAPTGAGLRHTEGAGVAEQAELMPSGMQHEEGEGYAPLPRPSIAAPIGGAILPTQGGFAAPKTAETQLDESADQTTGAATLGTLQGGLQPGYTGDVAASPRKSGKERGGMLGNIKSMLSHHKK